MSGLSSDDLPARAHHAVVTSPVPAYLPGPPETRTERFFEHWLGPATAPAEPATARPGIDFPDVLRRHHETRSRWAVPLDRMCRLLHPADVSISAVGPPQVTVILEEEQGVQEWGFDTEHRPWTREVEDGEPWVPVDADLGSFLLGYELVEAAVGMMPATASAACAWMERRRVDAVISPLAPLPLPAFVIAASPHRLYGNDDVLALVGPNPNGGETPETATGSEVWMAGRRPGALDWLADLEGVVHGEGGESRGQLEPYDGIVWDALRLT